MIGRVGGYRYCSDRTIIIWLTDLPSPKKIVGRVGTFDSYRFCSDPTIFIWYTNVRSPKGAVGRVGTLPTFYFVVLCSFFKLTSSRDSTRCQQHGGLPPAAWACQTPDGIALPSPSRNPSHQQRSRGPHSFVEILCWILISK